MLKLIGDYMCNEIIKRENKNWSAKEDIILLNDFILRHYILLFNQFMI